MRRGDKRVLKTLEHSLELEYLGKGQFSTVWSNGDKVYYVTEDHAKEAIADWSDIENPHVPSIRFFDYKDHWQEKRVYTCPMYKPLMAKHKEAWKQYKILKEAREEAWEEAWSHFAKTNKSTSFNWFLNGYALDVAVKTIEKTRDKLPEELTEALESICDALAMYGSSMTFEFSKRNLAIDDKGRLVLLDIAFDANCLQIKK